MADLVVALVALLHGYFLALPAALGLMLLVAS